MPRSARRSARGRAVSDDTRTHTVTFWRTPRVWGRDMRISSLTDLILQKLLRVKQIEDNQGQTLVSEGIDANYQDMVNYAAFALIKLQFPA